MWVEAPGTGDHRCVWALLQRSPWSNWDLREKPVSKPELWNNIWKLCHYHFVFGIQNHKYFWTSANQIYYLILPLKSICSNGLRTVSDKRILCGSDFGRFFGHIKRYWNKHNRRQSDTIKIRYHKNRNRLQNTGYIAVIWNIVLETGPSAYDYSKDPNHPLKASFLKKLHSDK